MTSPARGADAVTQHLAIRAKVAATRARQGLPPTVEDPGTLERVAAVLRLVSGDGKPDARRLSVRKASGRAPGGGA